MINKIEGVVEKAIWGSRKVMFFAALACLLAFFAVLGMTIIDLIHIVMPVFREFTSLDFSERPDVHQETLKNVVGLVDSFLVAIFLLVFSYGIYELFVSELDPARQPKNASEGDRAIMGLLAIHSLDDLKQNLIKVVSAILIVTLFENAVAIELQSPLELIYFAIAILLIACALLVMNLAGSMLIRSKGH